MIEVSSQWSDLRRNRAVEIGRARRESPPTRRSHDEAWPSDQLHLFLPSFRLMSIPDSPMPLFPLAPSR